METRTFGRIMILFLASMAMASCDDDDKTETSLSSKDLYQTTWSGVQEVYNEINSNEVADQTQFILQFITQSKGKYIFAYEGQPYGDGEFDYQINQRMMSFQGAIVGNWTIMEKSKNHIVLEAYQPMRCVMTLTKQY